MLVENMPLKRMIDFKPHAEDMAMLPLDVVLYMKVTIVSLFKEDNYTFIRFLFNDPDIRDYLKDIGKTVIYDFDGTATRQERFVTIFELYGLKNYTETSMYLKELMEYYTHEADALIDIYTHDDKEYRLSNLDGIVKLEELDNKIELKFDE
ncbi:MAG: hypothetical protein IJJ00_07005 [Erysipelotrichaceae bacterium]|nr:hypothetical protein [Erysipelotrichaceae bacterium]